MSRSIEVKDYNGYTHMFNAIVDGVYGYKSFAAGPHVRIYTIQGTEKDFHGRLKDIPGNTVATFFNPVYVKEML